MNQSINPIDCIEVVESMEAFHGIMRYMYVACGKLLNKTI